MNNSLVSSRSRFAFRTQFPWCSVRDGVESRKREKEEQIEPSIELNENSQGGSGRQGAKYNSKIDLQF